MRSRKNIDALISMLKETATPEQMRIATSLIEEYENTIKHMERQRAALRGYYERNYTQTQRSNRWPFKEKK